MVFILQIHYDMSHVYLYRALLTTCLWVVVITVSFGQSPIRIGNGNTGGVQIRSSHDNHAHNSTINGLGLLPNETAASRFLAQATLGADYTSIQATTQKSYNEWLEEQFQIDRPFLLEDLTRQLTVMALDSTFARGGDPNRIEPRLLYWHTAWWQYTMTAPDVLRARIALGLSEIFVLSELPDLADYPLALANYYDVLLDHSFGNFRDLLQDITLHPAMGLYLTHINNPKADPSRNRFPDENYAREVMQLFTIGLYMLNSDGTQIMNEQGTPVPTYDNEDIYEFAKVFTGLSFGDAYLFGQRPLSEQSFLRPMRMFDQWHQTGTKKLLLGDSIPDRPIPDGMADIDAALDNLFNHPNVGPFIGRLLIQRLVKSNPSPEYIQRVTEAFNDNGKGERGDMKSMIRAILLDPEARDCYHVDDPWHGMLKEPIVRYTQLCRGLNAASEEGLYRNAMQKFYRATFQKPLGSPSVFNFFQPDYQPIGSIADNNLVGPEFQITNSVSITGYANLMHNWLISGHDPMEFKSIFSGEKYTESRRTYLGLDIEFTMAEEGQLNAVLERLNLILAQGQLSEETKAVIMNAMHDFSAEKPEDQIRLMLFLIMVSPDFLVLR